jgi:Transglutaminase-like superfamily
VKVLVLRAYWKLICFEFYLRRRNFAVLYNKVHKCRLAASPGFPDVSQRICAAVDLACILYWKEVLCLQRSAATTCLLKECGVSAMMMIGAQQMPFKAHAWVEVEGRVVNDKPYMRQIYAVLDQC